MPPHVENAVRITGSECDLHHSAPLRTATRSLSRRAVLSAVTSSALAAFATGCSNAATPEAPTTAPATPVPQTLRTLAVPFTGSPRLVVMRDRPSNTSGVRWLDGARAQAGAAGVDLVEDGNAVDGPSLVAAVRRAVDDGATAAILIDGLYLSGFPDLDAELARAAARGLPVAVQTAFTPLPAPLVVRADEAQLMTGALDRAPSPGSGLPVGLVAPIPGYGDLDRRVAAWATIRDARGWREVLLDAESVQNVTTDPDGGLTASLVRAAAEAAPPVQLVAAPSAFLATAAAAGLEAAGVTAASLAAVLDPEDDDIDLTPLMSPTGPSTTAALLDPAELGAASVRAVALLLAGQLAPGSVVEVPGQVVTSDDLTRLGATSTAALLPHLSALRGGTSTGAATADWLPAVSIP